MSGISKTRRGLYRLASILGDVDALTSGSPRRVRRRVANKIIGRKVVRRLWR